MKKLALLMVVAILAISCTTMSSLYNGARPDHLIKNRDGSVTFEFIFNANTYNQELAVQRIKDYWQDYMIKEGWKTYQVLSSSTTMQQRVDAGKAIGNGMRAYGAASQANAGVSSTYIVEDPHKNVVDVIATLMFR